MPAELTLAGIEANSLAAIALVGTLLNALVELQVVPEAARTVIVEQAVRDLRAMGNPVADAAAAQLVRVLGPGPTAV